MASVFGHAISAIGIGKLFPKAEMTRKVYVLGVISSMLPDLDVIGFEFGLQWESMWSHRGFTHSFFFAGVWAMLLIFIYHRKKAKQVKYQLGSYYFVTTASHGLLDAMTNGGNGITFFAPFSAERYFLPWEVIQVSPLGISNFFSKWGVEVLKSEFIYIVLPSLLIGLIGHWLNKKIYQ